MKSRIKQLLKDDRLKKYQDEAYEQIEGWLNPLVLWALEGVADFQKSKGIAAGACEIGIHHGRFFIALENVTAPEAPCYALDIFERQELNIDRSGSGSREIFEGNLKKYATKADRVEIHAIDSTSAEARQFFQSIAGKVSLFSVDGGHTIAHTVADLQAAEIALADGGLVFLDDYFNQHFPSVTEGILTYLRGPHRLIPVMAIGGKLLFAGISYAPAYIAHYRGMLKASGFSAKTIMFGGYPFWSVR